ncbi:VOC family protein [Paracoccus aerodenitrificans]|uniref:VOC family protein n=1 Tax=Paracoccus aerodenitrificans TaxID=3017781 RepID=UPI0022F0CFE7|nr:VOC family protein [Paracoccus aerodenitrificans]WBU64069.1 VOC family protein [Paracoccus aerodenitrificans]
MNFHGNPCWYELTTSQGKLADAGAFYREILGWDVADSGMEGFDYHIASVGDSMVAGLMNMPDDVAGMPPCWMIYFAVDNCDAFCEIAVARGARVFREPEYVPGTGRFAILADPQGAAFGVMQPEMTDETRKRAEAGESAFDQNKAGHGNWNELMTSDPEAGQAFYSGVFGWAEGEAMDMGEMGVYQLIRREGKDIGAVMGLGNAPVPAWLPYFGVDGSVTAKVDQIKAAGGTVLHGPVEVPGPAFIAVAQDPQGAGFAVVGPEK